MADKRISIHVTHADCDFACTKGGGPGGQNVNKRSTKVRCTHRKSGAVGMAFDERSQDQNKKLAFMRMARTETFRRWAYLEAARLAGTLERVDEAVERAMQPGNLRLEVKNDDGRWTEKPIDAELSEVEHVAISAGGSHPTRDVVAGRGRGRGR